MKHILTAISLSAALTCAAAAELPPHIYEADRRAASHVIVIENLTLTPFSGAATSGSCTLSGRIASVERGGGYTPGQPVSVSIACITSAWRPMPGPFPGYSQDNLKQLVRARVFVTDGHVVRRGLDAVSEDHK